MNTDTIKRLLRSVVGRKGYPGYRMTKRSNAAWDKLENEKMRTQLEWAEIEKREAECAVVVRKAHSMIAWAHQSYEEGKRTARDIRTLTAINLNWSPQRVLTTHADFARICVALSDEHI